MSIFAVPRPMLKTVVKQWCHLEEKTRSFFFSPVLNTPTMSVFLARHYLNKLSASVQLHDIPHRSR